MLLDACQALLHIHFMWMHNNYVCISLPKHLHLCSGAYFSFDAWICITQLMRMSIEEQFGGLTFKSTSKQNTWSKSLFFLVSWMSNFSPHFQSYHIFSCVFLFIKFDLIPSEQKSVLRRGLFCVLCAWFVICYYAMIFIVGFGLLVCKVHQSFYAHITLTHIVAKNKFECVFSLPIEIGAKRISSLRISSACVYMFVCFHTTEKKK